MVSCIPDIDRNTTHHGDCVYDNDIGESVWKCHPGYEGDCTKILPCKDRCLNGADENCVEDEDSCNCTDSFFGQFCEEPSACHPGLSTLIKFYF